MDSTVPKAIETAKNNLELFSEQMRKKNNMLVTGYKQVQYKFT
jgi:hypothetical protein